MQSDETSPAREVETIVDTVSSGETSTAAGMTRIDELLDDLERWHHDLDLLKLEAGGQSNWQLRTRTLDGLRHYSHSFELLRRWLLNPAQGVLASEAIKTARAGEKLIASLRTPEAQPPGPDGGR